MSYSEMVQEALNLHNGYRAEHGVTSLQWSPQLAAEAETYAHYLASKDIPLMNKPNSRYGQNVFEFRSPVGSIDFPLAIRRAIEAWYKGLEDYSFIRGSSHGGIRGQLFSQVVWRNTERVGMGVASSGNRTVVIAFYDPPGNRDGEFAANVSPAKKTYVDVNRQREESIHNRREGLNNSQNVSHHESSSSTENRNEYKHQIEITSSSQQVENRQTQNYANQALSQQMIETNNTNTGNVNANYNQCDITSAASQHGPTETIALERHNQIRRKHQVAPLRLDAKLCEAAMIHAKSLLSGNKALSHLGVTDTGKNIYEMPGSGMDSEEHVVCKAIESFYSQRKTYNYESPMYSGKYAGIFTQLVWKDTERLGVGVAKRGDHSVVVCLYSPQGNINSVQSHVNNVFKEIL